MLTTESKITEICGISDARAKLFAKLDIYTVDDLVNYYPRKYQDRGSTVKAGEVSPGTVCSVILEILSFSNTRIHSKGKISSVQHAVGFDGTGSVKLTFFNQSFLENTFIKGRKFRFYGNVSGSFLSPEMMSPEYEPVCEGSELCSLFPIYPLTKGISTKMILSAVKKVIDIYKNIETLPEKILSEYNLCPLYTALYNIHFPEDKEAFEKARKRLAFEELLVFQLKLRSLKSDKDKSVFYDSIGFQLTDAQKKSIDDILYDMTMSKTENMSEYYKYSEGKTKPPCRRLIQGDVGSGKTIVAACAVFAAAKNKYQSALMVPTEILAKQHFDSLRPLFEKHHIVTALLTGSTKRSDKNNILKALSDGRIDFVIGTHALIEDNVNFYKLGLVITDEQHRFGVKQRDKLSEKPSVFNEIYDKPVKPHMIVMSATPIPRTLAMILYGDLDISIIDSMPPGRQKVDTFAVGEDMHARVYKFIQKLVAEGRQAYIVCPLVQNSDEDESDDSLKAAVNYCEKLKNEIFPGLKTDFIHGKMKQSEKDEIMKKFSDGETDILVSTTIIEVGVNVPNASVMIIENAERFGLSQLHQLRGRVGRGTHKSYCILISPLIFGNNKGENPVRERFKILCEHSSGFDIAEYDLKLRGPGDFFGKRQHGEISFKIADIAADMEIVEMTKKLADILSQGK